ncbi:hypothetical protein GRI97_01205 [Altererythrobacter xixiisoli]|uniref:Uncharacterized protein n=1 Tax=Croceibacterium xixiisoli TaxID=1476466 RepID=A0A6I4TNF3_9SPHN|nr:hypothetical protein [Croceibacterium xixiisoli]MXO97605.1 hypothetical protein [Croceibacterium xixiisoli]
MIPAITPLFQSLLFAQASAVGLTGEEARLQTCMAQARQDPASAITEASQWASEVAGPDESNPQQCLAYAYMSLLRWQAAEEAFLAARNARAPTDSAARARLAAMAGNAALAEERHEAALTNFDLAIADARSAGNMQLAGEAMSDRARALVGLDREDEARQELDRAQKEIPQDAEVWLLSATLARRQDDLTTAQAQIATAARLAPQLPAVGLEAGLIAALAGDEAAARKSWHSVIELAPNSPEAAAAGNYLAQLDGAPAGR